LNLKFAYFWSAKFLLDLLIFDFRLFEKTPPTRRTLKAMSARNAAGVPENPRLKNLVWQSVPVKPSAHLHEGIESWITLSPPLKHTRLLRDLTIFQVFKSYFIWLWIRLGSLYTKTDETCKDDFQNFEETRRSLARFSLNDTLGIAPHTFIKPNWSIGRLIFGKMTVLNLPWKIF